MIVENPFVQAFFVSAALLAFAAPAVAQPGKIVEVEIPDDPSRPPIANPPVIEVAPGEEIRFIRKGNGNVFVVFTNEGKTPFTDNQGQPVYSFPVVQAGGRFTIRDDRNPCAQTLPGQSECKYMLVDLRFPQRPPLDPYIIIHR